MNVLGTVKSLEIEDGVRKWEHDYSKPVTLRLGPGVMVSSMWLYYKALDDEDAVGVEIANDDLKHEKTAVR